VISPPATTPSAIPSTTPALSAEHQLRDLGRLLEIGSIGLVDRRARMSLGYVMNKQGPGTLLNPRGQSLVDAAYRSLGYVEAGGNWVR
jgi:hypothetical protein